MAGGRLDSTTYKIAFLGQKGAGKTSLIKRAVTGKYRQEERPSVGPDLSITNVDNIRIEAWDITGDKYFRTMNWYCKEPDAIVLVLDPYLSGVEMDNWIHSIRSIIPSNVNIPVVVVWTKSDVLNLQCTASVKEYYSNIIFYGTTSAKDNSNIDNLFSFLITQIKNSVSPSIIPVQKTDAAKNIRHKNKTPGFWERNGDVIFATSVWAGGVGGTAAALVGAFLGAPVIGIGAAVGAAIFGSIGYLACFAIGFTIGVVGSLIADYIEQKQIPEQSTESTNEIKGSPLYIHMSLNEDYPKAEPNLSNKLLVLEGEENILPGYANKKELENGSFPAIAANPAIKNNETTSITESFLRQSAK